MLALGEPLVLLHWSFAIISCATATHARVQDVYERFQAVETGALLSPRYYPPSPAQPHRKRQSICADNQHSCFELPNNIGDGYCCANDQYCIVNPSDSTKPGCCKIGSTCGSPCSESAVACVSPTTFTSAGTTSTSLVPACCPRQCPQTSMFGCPESLGNGCCSYGSTCAPNKKCISTIQESTTESAIVPLVPDGCTTSQISCAPSLGGGCCAVTQSCVRLEGDPPVGCAEVTVTPTASGITAVPTADAGLSAGAKAGISVGVIVIAGLVIGVATYMCLRRRRRRRSVAASSSANPRPGNVVGALIGGGAGGRDMTDLNSDSVSRPGVGLPGVAQDYFGPDPQLGPYSDAHHAQLSPGATPGAAERGGVPIMPHGPGDIAAPVEIDSRPAQSPASDERGNNNTNHDNNGSTFQPPPSHVAFEGTFELYGSDPDPPRESVTPYIPSPGSHVSPSGETIPSPSPGIDSNTGRR
ncbi:hypothetical protein V8F06_003458 [Rhypophila decipiens]